MILKDNKEQLISLSQSFREVIILCLYFYEHLFFLTKTTDKIQIVFVMFT